MRVYVLLAILVGLSLYSFVDQVERKAKAEQALASASQAVKDVRDELKQLQERKAFDEQLIAGLELERRELKRQSRESQAITKRELQNETCTYVGLPGTSANRLQQRIHSQRKNNAGASPG